MKIDFLERLAGKRREKLWSPSFENYVGFDSYTKAQSYGVHGRGRGLTLFVTIAFQYLRLAIELLKKR